MSTLNLFSSLYTNKELFSSNMIVEIAESLQSVLVIGDCILDEFSHFHYTTNCREGGDSFLGKMSATTQLGGAGNLARSIIKTILVTKSGNDMAGREIEYLLNCNRSANQQYVVQDDSSVTPRVSRFYTRADSRTYKCHRQRLNLSTEQSIANYIEQISTKQTIRTVMLADYGRGVCSHGICELISNLSVPNVIVDVRPAEDFRKYDITNAILTPNRAESKMLLNFLGYNEKIVDTRPALAAELLLSSYPKIKAILLTRDSGGLIYKARNEKTLYVPTPISRSEDFNYPSGCGDIVNLTMALFAEGVGLGYMSIMTCLQMANLFAYTGLSEFGTSTLSLDLVRTAIDNTKTLSTHFHT